MRRKCVFLMFLATLAMFSCTVSKTSQKRSEQQTLKTQVIRQQVDAQHYEIRVRQAFPLGRSPLTFSESFSLTISGDSIISYLPYFGRVHGFANGGYYLDYWPDAYIKTYKGKALNFTGTIREYQATWLSDEKVRISIIVETDEDVYQYEVDVFVNGSANIRVMSRKLDYISFSGEILDT